FRWMRLAKQPAPPSVRKLRPHLSRDSNGAETAGRRVTPSSLLQAQYRPHVSGRYTGAYEAPMKKYGKFAVLIVVILGTLIWLATAGAGESKTYYKTITEVRQMGVNSGKKRVRVIGDVEKDSIQRKAGEVEFVLVGDNQKLKVVYTGSDPLPDTFRDGAQALAEGKMGPDGAFHAGKIQAKCASKYAAKPGEEKQTEGKTD